jgi:hypothetical protein
MEKVSLPIAEINAFCEQNHIRKLALFGSVLRPDFNSQSDIDVLVEFESSYPVDFFMFVEMQEQLSQLLGRDVDLNTPDFLSRHFRQHVLDTAEIIYERI